MKFQEVNVEINKAEFAKSAFGIVVFAVLGLSCLHSGSLPGIMVCSIMFGFFLRPLADYKNCLIQGKR